MQKYFDLRDSIETHQQAASALNALGRVSGLTISVRQQKGQVRYSLTEASTDEAFQVFTWIKAAIEGRFYVLRGNVQSLLDRPLGQVYQAEAQRQTRQQQLTEIAPKVQAVIESNAFLKALNWRSRNEQQEVSRNY